MKLLVSVRDVSEAQIAIDAGVDLIDLKEPRDGSLGSTSPAVWEAVASLLPDGLPMSIALGELVTLDAKALQRIPHRVNFAKVGNAGLALRDAESSYRRWIHELPSWVEPVAVFYADHTRARSLDCDTLLSLSAKLGISTLLIDTFTKDGRTLFDFQSVSTLQELVRRANELQMKTVLAGSLRQPQLSDLACVSPDYIALRGAICKGDRDTVIDRVLLNEWLQEINSLNAIKMAK